MANILYGVNGEGAGHSTRSKEVIRHLQAQGHTVKVASFDRGLRNLSDVCEAIEIFGLRFSFVNNRVRYDRTVLKNVFTAPRAVASLRRLSEFIDDCYIDLVITDFEPLTCRIARRKRLPVISIDNQHTLTNTDVSYPKQYHHDAAAAKLVTRMMTPQADAYLATTFFAAKVTKKNTILVPPILREEVINATSSSGEHVLVYVTSLAPALAKVLGNVRCKFVAYGFGHDDTDGNITFKKPSMDGFMQDLTSARAIIANAGFSLVTEALHLGKPYLAIPVAHQFEQVFNAYYLDKMGFGAFWEELNKERIESFLHNLPFHRENLAAYPRQDNSVLFSKLDELVAQHTRGRATTAGA